MLAISPSVLADIHDPGRFQRTGEREREADKMAKFSQNFWVSESTHTHTQRERERERERERASL